jgi:hypothetical protein
VRVLGELSKSHSLGSLDKLLHLVLLLDFFLIDLALNSIIDVLKTQIHQNESTHEEEEYEVVIEVTHH